MNQPKNKPIDHTSEEYRALMKLLETALRQERLYDRPGALGEMIAAAEEPRVSAYDSEQVLKWLHRRELIPAAPFKAICSLIKNENHRTQLTVHYAKLSTDASTSAKLRPLHRVLDQRLRDNELKMSTFAKQLSEHGKNGKEGEPYGVETIGLWRRGINPIPKDLLPIMDIILTPEEGELSLEKLARLHDIPKSLGPLAHITSSTPFAESLYWIRQACGISSAHMVREMNARLGIPKPLDKNAYYFWEKEPGSLRAPHFPSARSFPDTTPLQLLQSIMTDYGFGDWWQSHATILRNQFRAADLHYRFHTENGTDAAPATASSPDTSTTPAPSTDNTPASGPYTHTARAKSANGGRAASTSSGSSSQGQAR